LTVAPVTKLKQSKRLGASVTKSQGKGASAVTTPLGPAQSLAPAAGTHGVKPANGAWGGRGAICFRNVAAFASTTATTRLERSAGKERWLPWSTQLMSKEYIAPAVLLAAVTGTGMIFSSLMARSSDASLAWAACASSSRGRTAVVRAKTDREQTLKQRP